MGVYRSGRLRRTGMLPSAMGSGGGRLALPGYAADERALHPSIGLQFIVLIWKLSLGCG